MKVSQQLVSRSKPALAALMLGSCLLPSTQAGAATITHHYDWEVPFTNINMCRVHSSGESLADIIPPGPPHMRCPPETALGDLFVEINWNNNEGGSAIWGADAGNGIPGVTVTSPSGNQARLSQTGDTFLLPWTLSNLTDEWGIVEVVLTARGTPDMGFDTDAGDNPGHGGLGFPLYLDDTSAWDGALDVYYDLWNNWNDTTDMFHRMRLVFDPQTPVLAGADMVFMQDTDEIPLPPSAALLLPGLVALALARRGRRRPVAGL